MGLWLWFKVTLLFVSKSLLFGGSGLVMRKVCDCGLCVSDLGGLGLSGQRILIEWMQNAPKQSLVDSPRGLQRPPKANKSPKNVPRAILNAFLTPF